MEKTVFYIFLFLLLPCSALCQPDLEAKLRSYVERFNADDGEAVVNLIPNSAAAAWLRANIPLLDCPDSAIEQAYYFRWWSFRKHIKQTPDGTIVTEFIEPVRHAGRHNAISCALGHHLYEGRWLKDSGFLEEYVDFWLYHADEGQSRPRFHQFSSWLPDALLAYAKVTGNEKYLIDRLPDLDRDYAVWENERRSGDGLFWQYDVQDGMEESVSGARREKNMRPTINSYMYGNARALATIARLADRPDLERKCREKADRLHTLLLDSLWDREAFFFKTRLANGGLHPAREAIGFIPWYFHAVPDKKNHAAAWRQVVDTAGFKAPWGLTTAEQREPTFRTRGSGHGCEWDGAIWPFATSQTLRAMANLLADYEHKADLRPQDFYEAVAQYAKSHQMNGKPYIGEYQDERTGEWLKGDHPRSKYYNHSTFADVVIQDLIGFKPMLRGAFAVKPLVPSGKWPYFALQNITYKGRTVAVFWDERGDRYNKGKGLHVFVDGKRMAYAKKLKSMTVNLK